MPRVPLIPEGLTIATSPMHENGYREYLPLDEGFFALLGSVNGSNTMRMLVDHKRHVGHKTVEKMVVLPCAHGAADVDDFKKQRSFVLVLSNKRKPMAVKSNLFYNSSLVSAPRRTEQP